MSTTPRPAPWQRREHKWILNGKVPAPCRSLLDWAMWMETAERRVARTELMDGEIMISTVFIGIDMGRGDRPLLFETMVFGESYKAQLLGGSEHEFREDLGQWRYCTWDEAEAGHAKAVAMMVERIRQAEDATKRAGRTVEGSGQ